MQAVTTSQTIVTEAVARRDKSSNLRFLFVLALLIAGGLMVNAWQSGGDAKIARQPLKGFPAQLGTWGQVGKDERFDAASEAVLGASDYLLRTYAKPSGESASFYAGYYSTQRTGATYHSPLNCLPGSGWVLTPLERVTIAPREAGIAPFAVNQYLIAQGDNKQLMLYWYMGRGRNTASEYRDKINTVLDSITRRRSDGAMVRVLVPVAPGGNETRALETARQNARELAELAAPQLATFIPN